jgi:glycosyltransferase involved in cell wall biosynthesis
MTPELSICIPTYNRRDLLARSLNAVLHQSSGLPIEICVSNNSSPDGTEELLRSLPVRYETRAQNIGIDRNILAAIRMARGRYVLPIGDDEVLLPGAVASIVAALRAQPDLLILNGGCVTTRASLEDAFVLLWDKMPLGGFVAPGGYANPLFADRYLGTYHAYSGAAWDFLLDRLQRTGRIAIVSMAEPLVEFHRVEKSWAAESGAIHFEEIPRWFDLLPAYYASASAIGRRIFRRRCSTTAQLIRFRAERQLTRSNVSGYFRAFGWAARLRAQAISRLPARAAVSLIRAARAAKPC